MFRTLCFTTVAVALFLAATTVVNAQIQKGCSKFSVSQNVDKEQLRLANTKIRTYLAAYRSESLKKISKAINPKDAEKVEEYLKSTYSDKGYKELRSGIKRICVITIESQESDYFALVRATLEYKNEHRNNEPVFFYLQQNGNRIVFTPLMFANYETYHVTN